MMSVSSGVILSYGDEMYLSDGDIAYDTTVNSGGYMSVDDGGTANSTTVNHLGYMYVSSCGTANDTIVNSGGNMAVYSGGTANATTVNESGTLYVFSGGTASATTVNSGYMYVYSGGTATNIAWTPCVGHVSYHKNAYVTFTSQYSGIYYGSDNQLLSHMVAITGQTIHGRNCSMFVMSGGTANSTTVNESGTLYVDSGGTANSTTVNGWSELHVSSGGTANDTTLNSGHLYVSCGGIANGTTVNSGGYMMTVYSGGTANTTTVNSNGGMAVRYGGTANNTTVNSGGSMTVSSGGMISGTLQIADDAVVSAHYAIIDFTVAEQEKPSTALINNWSLISGGAYAEYTLTVKADQAGAYTLAEGAANFANIITVKTVDNTTLGTLVIGETKVFAETSYTLCKNDGTLSLSIEKSVTVLAKSDVDGNGVSDVMFQYTGGDYQIGFWMNGTNSWQGQGIGQPSEWKLIGAYDMDQNGKADLVMRGDIQIGSDKGAYIGYYKDGDVTNWQNISFLNNSYDIDWRLSVGNITGNAGCNSLVWHAPELGALGVWTDGTANWVSLGSGYNKDWVMQGCGDFDGNGKDEVLFTYEGNLYSIDIDGNFAALGQGVNGWEVRAIGDFSGDGQDDIVLFHTETGSMMKFENGTTYQNLGQLDASDWFIAGCGDYNNDQKDDLLVRQNSSGMLGYYESGDLSKWVELGRGIDSNWTVVA